MVTVLLHHSAKCDLASFSNKYCSYIRACYRVVLVFFLMLHDNLPSPHIRRLVSVFYGSMTIYLCLFWPWINVENNGRIVKRWWIWNNKIVLVKLFLRDENIMVFETWVALAVSYLIYLLISGRFLDLDDDGKKKFGF